jgi:hypothetical protein
MPFWKVEGVLASDGSSVVRYVLGQNRTSALKSLEAGGIRVKRADPVRLEDLPPGAEVAEALTDVLGVGEPREKPGPLDQIAESMLIRSPILTIALGVVLGMVLGSILSLMLFAAMGVRFR